MCQWVSGEKTVLKERWAWKVFGSKELKPFIYTLRGTTGTNPYKRGRWYKSTGVKANPVYGAQTMGGFHVFKTKRGASSYRGSSYGGDLPVVKVRIRGEALPFEFTRASPGYAVHEMMIPEEGWKVGGPVATRTKKK